VLLAVLTPILVTVSARAIRVVETSVLLLLVRAGHTLLLRSRPGLSSRSASLALGGLGLESIIGRSSLRT